MSTYGVFQKDVIDVQRARIVWFVSGIYALLMCIFFYAFQRGASEPSVVQPLRSMFGIGSLVLPLVALVAAYLAIAGERQSGTIKFLLSLPNTRFDVVYGKFLSRSLVIVEAIMVAFLIASWLALLWYESLQAELFLRVFVLTVLYTLCYVSIAVGISAMTASRSKAMSGAIGVYFLTVVLAFVPGLSYGTVFSFLFNDLFGMGVSSNGIEFMQAFVSPFVAYSNTQQWAFDVGSGLTGGTQDVVWYLEPQMMFGFLAAWILLPVTVGYLVFERSELG